MRKIIAISQKISTDLFRHEDFKYSRLWATDYHAAGWKKLASRVLENFTIGTSLIDLGCGDGSALRFFQSSGFKVCGVDISSYAVMKINNPNVYHSSLDDLSLFPDNHFDLGFCNDVIEHVPEHLVRPSLLEMARICRQSLFISVCPKPAHHKSPTGENLHLTVKPEKWWEDRLSELGKLTKYHFLFRRSLRYRIQF